MIKFNRHIFRLERITPVICVFIITIFSHIIYPGYYAFIGDHKVYMPPILKALNPSLYSNDYLLSFSQLSYTVFDEIVVFLVNIAGAEFFTVLFCLSLIVRLIFYASFYKLSIYLTKDKFVSLFLVLFFCLAQIKFGSLNNYLLPRSFGIALGLLSLTLYFGQRRISSSIVLSICLLFHVPSFIPFAVFFYLALLTDIKKKLINANYLFLGLVPVIFLLLQLFLSDTSGLDIFGRISEEYFMFLKLRVPDNFLLSTYDFGTLIYQYIFNYILFGFAFYNIRDHLIARHVTYLSLVLVATFVLLIVTIVGGDVFKSVFIIQVHTIRAYQLLKIISATLFVYYTYIHVKNHPKDKIMNLMLIGTTVSLILLPHFAFLSLIVTITIFFLRRLSPSFYDTPRRYWLSIGCAACLLFALLWFSISGDLYSAKKLMCIFVFMFVAAFSFRAFEFSSVISSMLFILFLGAFTLVITNVKDFTIQPKYYRDKNFMELCEWIQKNTSTDAVFLTEPFSSKGEEIRITCYRSIYPTFKAIGLGAFNEEYAMKGMERYSLIIEFMKKMNVYDPEHVHSFLYDGSKPVIPLMRKWYKKKENKSEQDIEKILLSSPETETFIKNVRQKYKVDYIISEAPLLLKFPIAFKNNKYIVYKLI